MRTLLFIALLASLAGCAGTTPATREVALEETRLVASRTAGGELSVAAYTAEDLFREGNALVVDGDCEGAVTRFDCIAEEFPSSRFVSPALYNAGLCLQEAGDLAAAVERYGDLVRLVPGSSDVRHALLQMTAALVLLERWDEALARADELLTREDLDEADRLESLARRAQALLGLERLDDAEAAGLSTVAYFNVHRDMILDEHFAAAGQFVRAEALRLRAEAIVIPAADALTQHTALERRAALILDAQRAYYDAIRLTDAYWASASGFRIGAMYESLWQALTHAPVPPPEHDLSGPALQIYETTFREELTSRVRPLVRHAIQYWELTMLMVERTGVTGEWVERTRAELEHARTVLLGGSTSREGAGALGDPAGTPAATPASTDTSPVAP